MIPLQSLWPRWAYGLPIGNHNHYRRRCVDRHIYSIIYWILGKHIEHEPPTRHVHIMAGLRKCADAIPIASVPTRSCLAFSTLELGALLASIRQRASCRVSKYYFFDQALDSTQEVHASPGDGTQQSNLTQSITKNRPFYNPSRGRSIRQGSRLGGNYKEIKTCH